MRTYSQTHLGRLARAAIIAMSAMAVQPTLAQELGDAGSDTLRNCSAEDLEEAVANLKAQLPRTAISRVRCAPVEGLFEVVTGKNVFYVAKAADRLIVGNVFDLATQTDLTDLVKAELVGEAPAQAGKVVETQTVRADWNSFPENGAAISNPGAKYKLAMFSDLRCSFCMRAHLALATMKDVELHEYVGAILGPESEALQRAAVCGGNTAADVAQGYAGLLQPRDETCSLADANRAFMRERGWTGTPIFVRGDGQIMRGFPSADALRAFIEGGA